MAQSQIHIDSVRNAVPGVAGVRSPGIPLHHSQTRNPHSEDESRLLQKGRIAGQSIQSLQSPQGAVVRLEAIARQAVESLSQAASHPDGSEISRCLIDHFWLIEAAGKMTRGLDGDLRRYPLDHTPSVVVPRVYAVARAYLHSSHNRFAESGCTAFLNGFQESQDLLTGEVSALGPVLATVLLEGIALSMEKDFSSLQVFIDSLRNLMEFEWSQMVDQVSLVDRVLTEDPIGAYRMMDDASRELYRNVVVRLALRSDRSEQEIARAAVKLACESFQVGQRDRAANRRAHVGYYLIDKGLSQLQEAIGYKKTLREKIGHFLQSHPTTVYAGALAALTILMTGLAVQVFPGSTAALIGVLLLWLPVSQAAVIVINNLVSLLLRPRELAKLDFSRGVPKNLSTMVVVPTLLLNLDQVQKLVSDLEVRFLANPESNLHFALLTDWADSDRPVSATNDPLLGACQEGIECLNRRHGNGVRSPFYLFHRRHVFNRSEGRWMGWERKRGKLVELNRFLRGGRDPFVVKVGNIKALSKIRYIITLDSDTQLPPGTAHRLVGAIAHPLNQAVINRTTNMVEEGYGILQPRIGVSAQSATRSRLANFFSGRTGLDIYSRAISDVYQDLFGEGIFTGKGIYEIDIFRQSIENRFPENALLSHDLIEGIYARTALVTDVELIDDYPSHLRAFGRRKHRWARGDWQLIPWLQKRVSDARGNRIQNPIIPASRFKILDNLRRSMVEPATLLLLLVGWFWLPQMAGWLTLMAFVLMAAPAYLGLPFSLLRMERTVHGAGSWIGSEAKEFFRLHLFALIHLVLLPYNALLSVDAVVRSLVRMHITGKKLLEWETAAEAESSRKSSPADRYLDWMPFLSFVGGICLFLFRFDILMYALPVLAGWSASPWIARWLDQSPRITPQEWTGEGGEMMADIAAKTWQFYSDWSNAETNRLIVDNVREDGQADARLSPTNLGFLLNARVAAVHLGHLTVEEFADQSLETLHSIEQLPKHRGHLFNWYDSTSLTPLEPRFVSTVDSGNLAACLWTLKQAAAEFAGQAGESLDLRHRLETIAAHSDRLVQEMDFSFLYRPQRKLLSIGYHPAANRCDLCCYDLLASEARLAVFVAIAKGDVPQEAWFHLNRKHTMQAGERVLVSWSGTMFEYLMPALWMRHSPDSTLHQSMEAAVRVQRHYARRRCVPWGISESACRSTRPDESYGYSAFGVPGLALKHMPADPLVVAPYASVLALLASPRRATKNLEEMLRRGWSGRYGFYESVDFTGGEPEVMKLWMAHHQGMILLSICNLLCGFPLQRYFHSEPRVIAAELLLQERLSRAA